MANRPDGRKVRRVQVKYGRSTKDQLRSPAAKNVRSRHNRHTNRSVYVSRRKRREEKPEDLKRFTQDHTMPRMDYPLQQKKSPMSQPIDPPLILTQAMLSVVK